MPLRTLALLLLAALPAAAKGAAAPAGPPRPPFPIWPIPREARLADTRLLLTEATIVVPAGDTRAQYPGRLLAEVVADQLGVARRYRRDLLLRFKYNGIVLEVGGGMRLGSHPEVRFGWRRTVAEWCARGETMDKLGEGIPLGTARRFAASLHVGVGGGAYVEKEDVRQLADVAERLGLEVVPEVQALTHTYSIASARRDVAEDPDMPWPDSYCPSNPESYRIYFDVLDEYLDVLRPKRVHIGHDEVLLAHEIRCDGTVGRWDRGLALPFYFARPLVAGKLPDGRAAVVWASEWTNPRPDVPIDSVTLVGAPGPTGARPVLLGVTAVEKPRVEDLR